jgi:phospho-N-acetylmuramoyl-pentapeptide-transferase
LGDADEAAIYRLFNDLAVMSPDYADLKGVLNLEPLASRAEPADYFEEILRKKKIWQSTPIHHHFEALGWPSYQITMRFWILGIVLAALGAAIRLLG